MKQGDGCGSWKLSDRLGGAEPPFSMMGGCKPSLGPVILGSTWGSVDIRDSGEGGTGLRDLDEDVVGAAGVGVRLGD